MTKAPGPMLRARKIVEDHIADYGYVPHPDKLKEAVADALAFVEFASTPHHANAIEAAAVSTETGLTPRQLADERGKLAAVAEQALYAIDTVLSSHVGQAEYEELAAAFNALEAALTSSGRAPEGE